MTFRSRHPERIAKEPCDVRIEVQQEAALACWESAMDIAPHGHGGLDRSREGAWA
jgi:hypothetical protein